MGGVGYPISSTTMLTSEGTTATTRMLRGNLLLKLLLMLLLVEAKVYIWDPFPPIFIQFPFDLPRGNISLAVTLISNHHEGEF